MGEPKTCAVLATGFLLRVLALKSARDSALARDDVAAGADLHARMVEHETTAWIAEKWSRAS